MTRQAAVPGILRRYLRTAPGLFQLLSLQLFTLFILCPMAHAAPGGLIKAAAKSPIVQIVFAVLVVLFLPLIVWWLVKYHRMVSRTREDLKKLSVTHPQYEWLNLKDRVLETAQWVWSAWEQKKLNKASAYTTSWFWQNQQLVIDRWERNGLENVCELKQISEVTPLYVSHNPEDRHEGSRVVVLVKALVIDFMREVETGKILQGDEKEGELESVWTFMWDDGQWKLNLIEAGSEEFAYLNLPNVLPESSAGAAPNPSKA